VQVFQGLRRFLLQASLLVSLDISGSEVFALENEAAAAIQFVWDQGCLAFFSS